jgi:hypothetical protein
VKDIRKVIVILLIIILLVSDVSGLLLHGTNNIVRANQITVNLPAVDSSGRGTGNYTTYSIKIGYGRLARYEMLVRFDLSSIPEDAEIVSAELQLYCHAYRYPPGALYLDAHRIVDSWNSDSASSVAGARYASQIEATKRVYGSDSWGYNSWNITNLARQWHTKSVPNCGVLIRTKSTSEDWYSFYGHTGETGKTPRLVITYREPDIKITSPADGTEYRRDKPDIVYRPVYYYSGVRTYLEYYVPFAAVEDFEAPNLTLPFTGTWSRSTQRAYEGSYSYKSAAIGRNSSSSTSFSFFVPENTRNAAISFRYLVSARYSDYLRFYVDDKERFAKRGSSSDSWGYFEYPLSAGKEYTFRFEYRTRSGTARYDDAAYIDNLTIRYDDIRAVLDEGLNPGSGKDITVSLTDQFWQTLPYNTDLRFRALLDTGNRIVSDEITLRKLNTRPVISMISPTDGAGFHHTSPPMFRFRVYDSDGDIMTAGIQYNSNGSWQDIASKTNLSHGSLVEFAVPSEVWSSLPLNTGVLFRVSLYDGIEYEYKEITLRKTNTKPGAVILSPAGGSQFPSDKPPVIRMRVSDVDGDPIAAVLEYRDGSVWREVASASGLVHNETADITVPEDVWRSYPFYADLRFRVKVYDGAEYGYSGEITLIKPNTAPDVAIYSPVENQKMHAGYLPFSWSVEDVDCDDIHLKIWTETENIKDGGVLFDGSIGSCPYLESAVFRVYFPPGIHKIYFRFSDGFNAVEVMRHIDIQEQVDITGGAGPTFYIPVFETEKSSFYYNKINSMLSSNIYLFNILKNLVNVQYIDAVEGIENVTGAPVYNGDRIYNTDGEFDADKISQWIFDKASTEDEPVIRVVEAGTAVILRDIEFYDEEKDYTSFNPPRGRDRQFHFAHYPQVYHNADSEIKNNNQWIYDAEFVEFDGKPVERLGENIKINLNRSGLYTVSMKEQDYIINPYGLDMSKFSHPKSIDIYAHRRPKALLNYEENADGSVRFISRSYDLDFEFREDRGIAEEIYEYRVLNPDYTVRTGWQPVPDINSFRPDKNYVTQVRLMVMDYGARLDLANDGELSDSMMITFDDIGRPPDVDFEFWVGRTKGSSVTADGEIYRGNAGKETLHLQENIIWNDYFASGTRSVSWSRTEEQLRVEADTADILETTLTAVNRYGLRASVTRSVAVKEIGLVNMTPEEVTAGRDLRFEVELVCGTDARWGNFDVTVTVLDMGLCDYRLENEISNRFTGAVVLPRTLGGTLGYTLNIYSRRTGELVGSYDHSVEILTPIEIHAVIGTEDSRFTLSGVPVGERLKVTDIYTVCPIDIVRLEFALYDKNGTRVNYLITLVNPADVLNKDGDITYWKNVRNYQISESLSEGVYDAMIRAVAENGASAVFSCEVRVIELIIEGSSDKGTYAAGEAMILRAQTEGKAKRVYAFMWWAPGENGFADTNITQLVPVYPVSEMFNRWHTRHDYLGGDYDPVVIIPEDMPDGEYEVRFRAERETEGGGVIYAEDTITVRVSGAQLNKTKTRLIGR